MLISDLKLLHECSSRGRWVDQQDAQTSLVVHDLESEKIVILIRT